MEYRIVGRQFGKRSRDWHRSCSDNAEDIRESIELNGHLNSPWYRGRLHSIHVCWTIIGNRAATYWPRPNPRKR